MVERFHLSTLESGLTLLTVPMKGVASVTVLCMVRTGSRDEPAKLAGISHFLEHMVFKGTKQYPTAQAVASAIDSIGGEFNAFTSKEYTGFYVKLATTHLARGVGVLSDMLIHPKLSPDDVEREKGVIVEEINMYEDLPPRKVVYLYERLVYGNNNLGRETIGSPKTVRSIKSPDLSDYLQRRYTSGRMIVGVVGGVGNDGWTGEKIQDLVGQSFSEVSKGSDGWGKQSRVKQTKPRFALFSKETGQAHFILGVRSFKRGHPDRFALAVLATILGGNMSSRLFSEIREKRGLAYYVKSDVDTFFDTGSFVISAGVELGKLEDAVRITLEQFANVAEDGGKEGVTEEELEKAREYLKGRFILELEDSHEVADLFVRRYLLERNILTPEEFLGKIDAVELGDVVRVARKLFVKKNLNLAVIGPYDKKTDGQRLRKLLTI